MPQLAALRPYVTAGVAVVGAGLIAATPVVSNDVESILEQRAVELTSDNVVNPVQTWIDVITATAGQLQVIFDKWGQTPFVLPQQIAANWVQYLSVYVGAYQGAANGAISYFPSFVSRLQTVWADLTSGNITEAFSKLYSALFFYPSLYILDPLEKIPAIPGYIGTNLGAALTYLGGFSTLFPLGIAFFLGPAFFLMNATGASLQAVYDSAIAGDPVGVVTNLINIPGALAYAAVAQAATLQISSILNQIIPGVAKSIVAPDAQNIAEGGSLVVAIQDFINQLITGWPSLASVTGDLGNLFGGAAAVSPAAFSGVADVASLLPTAGTVSADIINAADLSSVVGGLSVLPADIAAVMGGLGADLGSMFNPAALLSMLPF